MYGAQTIFPNVEHGRLFENDVEMYGAQTSLRIRNDSKRLRMM